jgi:hypothetical protein
VLVAGRGSISVICENLKSALGLLNELKTEVTNKNSTLDMEMEKLQNILTPTQRAKVRHVRCSLARSLIPLVVSPVPHALVLWSPVPRQFIVWVTNNQACMHLLNKLWRSVL